MSIDTATLQNQVMQGDCVELLKQLPDNSVDLILTDPPYYKVKKEWWDNQWATRDGFIDWLRAISKEWQRILKPNGSLYCFCSTALSAHTEVMLSESFNVLNSIRWLKDAGYHKKTRKEDLRSYFPATESIIFCEHYNADNAAKGEAGYQAKCDELRGFVFEPLRKWFQSEKTSANASNKQINAALGLSVNGGGMASHYFGISYQWELPTEKHYKRLGKAFAPHFTRPYEELRQQYEELRQQYEELRQQYEELRRPFSVTADVPYTDVWQFPTVQAYKGKHPCEKPAAMIEHIIIASSKPGALVLDCFGGSGSTGIAAQKLGRNYLLFEIDPHWVAVARQRLGESTAFVSDESRREWLETVTEIEQTLKEREQLSLFAS